MSVTITRSEWLAALGEAEQIDDGGQTVEEFAEVIGVGLTTARRKIIKLTQEGKLVVGRRKIVNGWVKTYKLKEGK